MGSVQKNRPPQVARRQVLAHPFFRPRPFPTRTPVELQTAGRPGGLHPRIAVRLGTFDGDPGIRPRLRQFVAYAAPWEPLPDDGLPRHPERAG